MIINERSEFHSTRYVKDCNLGLLPPHQERVCRSCGRLDCSHIKSKFDRMFKVGETSA